MKSFCVAPLLFLYSFLITMLIINRIFGRVVHSTDVLSIFPEHTLPFIQDIPFNLVQFSAKKTTRFEVQQAPLTSPKKKNRKQHH